MSESAPTIPDFLIVGTMKSGTSTLADYLRTHPNLHLAAKEIHYFDRESNFEKGPEWYASKLTVDCAPEKRANALFGEKTPTYSYDPKCAPRIAEVMPDAKLIWIFRDPVKRTFSNYLHYAKKGADIVPFEVAVTQEADRIEENLYWGYVTRSKYVLQVERFLELYPREHMHFLLFEDFIRDPRAALDGITHFLGVDPMPEPLPQIQSNKTKMPLSRQSLWWVGQRFGYDSGLYKVTRKLNTVVSRKKPEFPAAMRPILKATFAPYNARLADLTGLDVSVWE